MSTTIFVVVDWTDSIQRAFTTKEKAKAFIEFIGIQGGYDFPFEEFSIEEVALSE